MMGKAGASRKCYVTLTERPPVMRRRYTKEPICYRDD